MSTILPLSSELNLTTIQEGVVHVNNVIKALNKTGTSSSVTYETAKLIGIILKTTAFRLESIQSTYSLAFQLKQPESRTKRELTNPFHEIGRAHV